MVVGVAEVELDSDDDGTTSGMVTDREEPVLPLIRTVY